MRCPPPLTWSRVSGRPDLFAAVAILAFTLATRSDVLFGRMLIGMDTATAFYPWYTFLGTQLRAGHIPVWNPNQFSGAPFAADPESGWMYLPAMLAFTLLPLEAAARSYIFFHAALAGLSTYGLARSLGVSLAGSAVATVAYVGCGFFAGHNVCCWAYAGVTAWLPLTLLGAERAIRATGWRTRGLSWAVAGLAVSQILGIWIGQASYYALLVLGSYVACRTLLASASALARIQAFVLNGGGVLVFGFGLAAAGVLPRLEYNVLSNLPGGYSDVVQPTPAWTDWGIVDDWYRRLLQPGFSYLGWSVAGLALAAPVLARRQFGVPYFAGLSVAVLILARYEPTPLHALLAWLPGFERIHARSPERALIVFYLGPAILAGATLTWLQARLYAQLRLPLAVVTLAVVAAELQLGWNAQRAESLAGGGDYQFEQVDLSVYYAPTAATRFLQMQARTDLFRYFGYAQHVFGDPIPYTLRWADASISALEVNNRAMMLGLDDIQGYNPIHVARYDDYIAALNGHAQNYHQDDVFDTGLDSALVDALNVRYIVIPASTPADQREPRFGRAVQTVYADENVHVLENPAALPRAWLVHAADQIQPGAAARTLAGGSVDLRQVALLEQTLPVLATPADNAADSVEFTSYEPDRLSLRTRTTAAGLVVLSETYYPAWHAYVDGSPVSVYPADAALRAIPVPAGEHTVDLRFESAALAVGVTISLVASAITLALVATAIRWKPIGARRLYS